MSEQPSAYPTAEQPPRFSDEFRSLRRSRSDRVVAGVLGGLGQRLGIDPVVLRVATVVLAIFGGVGVLLYAVAWLLVPAEGEDGSILDQALRRGEGRGPGTTPLALTLAVVGLVAGIGIIAGSWDGGVLLFLAAAGLFVLLRRRDDDTQRPATEPAPEGPEQTWFDAPHAAPGTVAAGDAAYTATNEVPSTGWPEGPDWGPPPTAHREPEPQPPAPAKRRSVLGPLTFCAALVAVGVLAVNDVYWASYPAAMYVAVPLGIVAVGLLVGAWYGRSRGLIFLGILLSIALVPATWASQWNFDNVGDATYRYTTIADMPADPVEVGAGDITYDLSDLALTDTDSVPLTIEMGAGDMTITVPPDADVILTATVGAGDMDLFGESWNGLGQSVTDKTDNGSDGPGGGEIVLNIDIGFGGLEVTR